MTNTNERKELPEEKCVEVIDKLYSVLGEFNPNAIDELTISLNLYLNICRRCAQLMKSKNTTGQLTRIFVEDISRNTLKAVNKLKESLKEEGLLND